MPTIYEQAAAIHKATGKPYKQIFETLRNNPPKQQPAPVHTQAAPADFMALVTAEMDRTGKSYRDAYLDVRKKHSAVFEQWLENVQA